MKPYTHIAQYKGPHYTHMCMHAPVLFHVSVLFTIWLHLISTCSVGHDPRDILDDGSIHLLGNVFGPTPEMPCKHLMVCGTSTKMQGLWPLQAGTPCTGVTHREGNSFVLLSELHLVDALTGSSSLRQIMTMGSDLMTRASRVPTHGPSARWLTSVRSVY